MRARHPTSASVFVVAPQTSADLPETGFIGRRLREDTVHTGDAGQAIP
ncbi:hypothetical protein [Caballeronia sordidicola]|nr:hypothetical protein [Caballeronia sordidicola]